MESESISFETGDEKKYSFNEHLKILVALEQKGGELNKAIRDMLTTLRRHPERRSEAVLHYGKKLLPQIEKIPNLERYEIEEQIIIAALDMNEIDLAVERLELLVKKFDKKSKRVLKLKGLVFEARQEWEKAEKMYQTMLEVDPLEAVAMKRQIAIRLALGKKKEAIELLKTYVDIFMNDANAWLQLAGLYLQQNLLKNAAFCYEELILLSPQNHVFLSKYAEICFTIGTYDHLVIARKFFLKALELSDKNSNHRALLGVLQTCAAISYFKAAKTDAENEKVFNWAFSKLTLLYPDKNSPIAITKIELANAKD